MLADARGRIELHHARRVGPNPMAVIAGQRPQPVVLSPVGARIEHRRLGFVYEQLRRPFEMLGQGRETRADVPGKPRDRLTGHPSFKTRRRPSGTSPRPPVCWPTGAAGAAAAGSSTRSQPVPWSCRRNSRRSTASRTLALHALVADAPSARRAPHPFQLSLRFAIHR